MNPGVRQSDSRPVRQYRHSPHVSMMYGLTRSPGDQPSTPSPSSSTSPASSTPSVCGRVTGKRDVPSRTSTSRWLSALALIRTSTSPGPGLRVVDLLDPKHVETPELVEPDCFHALDPPS